MHPLLKTLTGAAQPFYAVDAGGTIVLANEALCAWVGLTRDAVTGRRVAYHSTPTDQPTAEAITGLCPPPYTPGVATGEGTLSTMGRDGKLRHRRARFTWIATTEDPPAACVLVTVDTQDLTPQQLATALGGPATDDALHRHIRQFRRGRRVPAATALLLGDSPQARLMRRQFDLAVSARLNTTITGACPADTAALAEAIHYGAADPQARLIRVECPLLEPEEVLRQAGLALTPGATLLLLEANTLPPGTQDRIAELLRDGGAAPRVLATAAGEGLSLDLQAVAAPGQVHAAPLAERSEDLPVVAHYYLEQHNAGEGVAKAGIDAEVIDLLAVYHWPGGATQLGEVVAQACAGSAGPRVTAGDLPPLIRQAVLAASLPDAAPQPINLEAFLQQVEHEAIRRALVAARGNKAETARLLGLTRQRLYRRLQALELTDTAEGEGDA